MKIKHWSTPDDFSPRERGFHFFCPGCQDFHSVRTEGHSIWFFNNNDEKPTVTPSIKVTGHRGVCHLHLTDGILNFLDDCTTHSLRGLVPLPDFQESEA